MLLVSIALFLFLFFELIKEMFILAYRFRHFCPRPSGSITLGLRVDRTSKQHGWAIEKSFHLSSVCGRGDREKRKRGGEERENTV